MLSSSLPETASFNARCRAFCALTDASEGHGVSCTKMPSACSGCDSCSSPLQLSRTEPALADRGVGGTASKFSDADATLALSGPLILALILLSIAVLGMASWWARRRKSVTRSRPLQSLEPEDGTMAGPATPSAMDEQDPEGEAEDEVPRKLRDLKARIANLVREKKPARVAKSQPLESNEEDDADELSNLGLSPELRTPMTYRNFVG